MNGKIAKKIRRDVEKFGERYQGGVIRRLPRAQRNEAERYLERCRRRAGIQTTGKG